MSMSTSGVPRPSPGRIAKKANPAAGAAPDDTETEVDDTPTDKAPARAGTARTAKTAGSRTQGAKSAGSRTQGKNGVAAKSAAAKNTPPAKNAPAAKAAPATASKITTRAADAELDDDEDDALDSDEVVTPARKSSAKPVARTPAKTAARPGSKGPVGRGPVRGAGGGKGRKPSGRPIKVTQARNWTQIGLFATAAVVALAIVGFGIFALVNRPDPTKWKERADAIPGIVDYRNQNPAWLSQRNHVQGVQQYQTDPPVGGNHNPIWQNCMGNVYDKQIAKEHATHSMEHGAVWVAYRPDLPKDQVAKLASMVQGVPFTLMAPYPGLDQPISLQAWGFQLKVQDANDSRIPDFINDLRQSASVEPGAPCSQGVTEDGISTPLNLGN
jgi:Protein of unknown function (DUF3105)